MADPASVIDTVSNNADHGRIGVVAVKVIQGAVENAPKALARLGPAAEGAVEAAGTLAESPAVKFLGPAGTAIAVGFSTYDGVAHLVKRDNRGAAKAFAKGGLGLAGTVAAGAALGALSVPALPLMIVAGGVGVLGMWAGPKIVDWVMDRSSAPAPAAVPPAASPAPTLPAPEDKTPKAIAPDNSLVTQLNPARDSAATDASMKYSVADVPASQLVCSESSPATPATEATPGRT